MQGLGGVLLPERSGLKYDNDAEMATCHLDQCLNLLFMGIPISMQTEQI